MHQRFGKTLPVQILNAVAHFIQMMLDGTVGRGVAVGGVAPIGTDQALCDRRQWLPTLIAQNQTGLQIVTDIRLVRYRIGVCFVDVFITQVRPVMHA